MNLKIHQKKESLQKVNKGENMENNNKDIEKIQEELKYKIITLDDDNEDSKIKKIIDDVIVEMNKAFEKFKAWYDENKNSEKAQEIKDKFISEMNQLANKTSQVINDIKNNPELQEKLASGKETVVGLSKRIYAGVESGVGTILENEKVAKTIDTVSDKVVEVIQDEKVQKGIKATKKGILNVATSAYEGLKNILDDKEE